MNMEKVGEAIALLRKRAGYTQKELADRIGLSDKAVSKWERGVGLPEISYLRKLSILLDIDTDSLLAGNITQHRMDWEGILILQENKYDIGAGTVIYDKPLICYLISYFLLVGIKKVHIVCSNKNRRFINDFMGNGACYGFQLSCYDSPATIDIQEASNLMIVYGKNILYGVDQTRFFQRAMIEKNQLTILALPNRTQICHTGIDISTLESNKPQKIRDQYEYSRIPIVFMPTQRFQEMSCTNEDVECYVDRNKPFVEMLDRGFVDFELSDWDDVQDASTFIRIAQDRCGMNIYCLEEVAWRRGFISLEQLRVLGERQRDTEYRSYILSLYERMAK